VSLTEHGKQYIARNFGKEKGATYCFVDSGLSWTYEDIYGNTHDEEGGTAQVVSRLVITALVRSVTIHGDTYTYSDLKAGNDNEDVTLEDTKWIADHDSEDDEFQYCLPTVTVSFASVPSDATVEVS